MSNPGRDRGLHTEPRSLGYNDDLVPRTGYPGVYSQERRASLLVLSFVEFLSFVEEKPNYCLHDYCPAN